MNSLPMYIIVNYRQTLHTCLATSLRGPTSPPQNNAKMVQLMQLQQGTSPTLTHQRERRPHYRLIYSSQERFPVAISKYMVLCLPVSCQFCSAKLAHYIFTLFSDFPTCYMDISSISLDILTKPMHGLVTWPTQLPFILAMKDFFRLREEMWCVVRRVGSWAAGDKLLQLMGASIERELRTY